MPPSSGVERCSFAPCTRRRQYFFYEMDPPIDYGRPVRVLMKRRLKDDQYLHSYYISTLSLPSKSCFLHHDDRGGAEVEQFRNDKSGLSMEPMVLVEKVMRYTAPKVDQTEGAYSHDYRRSYH